MPLGESMLLTLKNNQKLRRLKKKLTQSFFGRNSEKESLYHFPEATPELLEKIRLQMIIQNREDTIFSLISLVITLLIILLVFI